MVWSDRGGGRGEEALASAGGGSGDELKREGWAVTGIWRRNTSSDHNNVSPCTDVCSGNVWAPLM